MRSCIWRRAGWWAGVPCPGPQPAASGFLLPGLGGPGPQAPLCWAPLSSLIPSRRPWTGLSWGLQKQGSVQGPRPHPPWSREVFFLTSCCQSPATSSLARLSSPRRPHEPHRRQDHWSCGRGHGLRSCPRRFAWRAGRRRSSRPWHSQSYRCHHPVRSPEPGSPGRSAEAVHQSAASPSAAAPPPGGEENGDPHGQ